MATTPLIGPVGGSQIDVRTLVRQLVAAERAPEDTRITNDTNKLAVQISALGALKGALSTFQSALTPLSTLAAFRVRQATSADPTVYTATVDSTAAQGNYQIEVTQLAQAHQLISKAFTGTSTAVVGTGTLTVGLGATNFSVTISSPNNTLAGIRDAINGAANNPGVRATLVYGTNTTQLVLTSSSTGAANAITVAASGGDGGLNQLIYNTGLTTNYTQLQAPLDSSIKVAGVVHTSASNTVTGAIDGVTLSLISQKPGTSVALSVSYNNAAVTANVNQFVSSYNSLVGQFNKLDTYNASTNVAGPMLGDSLIRGIESQLRRGLTDPIAGLSGQYTSLVNLGITTAADGTLTVDPTKLSNALNSNFDSVAQVFASTNGVAARLTSNLQIHLGAGSDIASRDATQAAQQKALNTSTDALNLRMAALTLQLTKQFTALDTLLSGLQSTSAFLTQQLGNLPRIGG